MLAEVTTCSGTGATRVKSGVQMASKFLEAWGGPYVAQLTEAAQIRQQVNSH